MIELTPFSQQESAAFFTLTAENRIYLRRFLPWLDSVQEEADTQKFIAQALAAEQAGKALNYFIRRDGEIIGTIGLREISPESAHVGYWLAEKEQGKGIMTFALQTLLARVAELKLTQALTLGCNPQNIASQKVATKCGFLFSHTAKNAENLYGKWHDLNIYRKEM